LLERARLHYAYRPIGRAPYAEPELRDLLGIYQRTLDATHLLFPAAGLRCLTWLAARSRSGLLLLSADKGDYQLAALANRPPPSIARHGSISLDVNYHAFRLYAERRGGVVLLPSHPHHDLAAIGLLLVDRPGDYRETQRAYQREVGEWGPDEFYRLASHGRRHAATMAVEDILAYLRLARGDPDQLVCYLPRLLELAPGFRPAERDAVIDAVERAWERYFPLGEELDLAHLIGSLLYALDDYARAQAYFERSLALYGPDVGTLYNVAACLHMRGEDESAAAALHRALQLDPENEPARALYRGLKPAG
jgi:tetratricopeptide (TPR) repeat protein